jgi:hypothetical protein
MRHGFQGAACRPLDDRAGHPVARPWGP